MPDDALRFDGLPGADLILRGLGDLAACKESEEAFLVRIASPKLQRCGVPVQVTSQQALEADHALYFLLAQEHGNEAHGRYNALLRELVSFERALEQRMSRAARVTADAA
ncbi:hypothetical protein WJU23_03250 [Prosthecobacter sp. SYSU 5D2]|uniref:hypothetical protein n=1 Tax=Prosthecobacter sp. SYSU 5D2 TaxID=3134134 RepID=UPI0031FF2A1D